MPKRTLLKVKDLPLRIVIGLSLLHVFTNPVVRHDFGAPLKHKSGIDSWILLHPDETERLLLLFIRIMGTLMAKMMAPLHNIQSVFELLGG